MPSGLRNERKAIARTLWRSTEAAGGKPTRLQDDQVDRAYRIRCVRKNDRRRRRRLKRRPRVFRSAPEHLTSFGMIKNMHRVNGGFPNVLQSPVPGMQI